MIPCLKCRYNIIYLHFRQGEKIMSSIIRQKVGKHIYLYESISYRNEDGKPRNTRKLIGKIDPKTDLPIYKDEYIARMKAAGTPIEQPVVDLFSVKDIKKSTIKEYGAYYLYSSISEQIGLTEILKEAFPHNWKEIFNFACYLVSSGEPALYCEDWIARTDSLNSNSMVGQRLSELFDSITEEERADFYKRWSGYRCEQEYLALDITSISSYSQLIDDVEWGYNRDKEKLPQINLCMLLGEESRLPVFQKIYSGSLKDVTTLKTTISLAANIHLENMMLVMDKGFGSIKNINAMLDSADNMRFLVALPFTLAFAKKQVISESKDIDSPENTIVIGKDIIRGVTKYRTWNKAHKVYTHVYYNALKGMRDKNDLYGHVSALKEKAMLNPNDPEYAREFKKYLIIRKSEKHSSGYTVNMHHDVIEHELRHAGWLVIVSNDISDAKEAITIYRAKDVVEKGFLRLKNCLDLGRLRIHSNNTMENKVFIGFIALILMSHIHKVMLTEGLYKAMTMKKLIKTLEKLKVQELNGHRILYPVTKEQKTIYEAFNVKVLV